MSAPGSAAPIIVPPPGVRDFLETTATFVAKKPAVEPKILARHQNDPNFSFLNPADPYHAYYLRRVAEVRAAVPARARALAPAPVPAPAPAHTTTTAKSAVVSILKAARVKQRGAAQPSHPPSDDVFTIPRTTPSPTPLALDVIKLAAEFVARYGHDFLAVVARKEARNSLFDFLKPLHPHYIIFQRLLEAYKLLLNHRADTADLVKRLRRLTDRKAVMDAVWYMHDWECLQAEREHDAALDQSERIKAAMIDWHDFVVLETIHFNDNDVLPPPIADTHQLPRILAAAQKAESERINNASDVDMEIDEPTKDPRMHVDTVTDIPSNLIRPSTTPRQQPHQLQQKHQETTIVLPSGQKVPLSKVEESVKAELINPAYKDERARAAEKNRLQNLAGGEEMARNLARLDARRKDGVVYNRADLQDAIPQPPDIDEEVERRLGKPVKSGPELPDGRVMKKARIEKAVEELSKKKTDDEADPEDGHLGEADGTGNGTGLLSEEAWLAKQGNSALVRIRLPNHPSSEWKLEGQEIEMKAPLKRSVAKLKGVITKLVKIPVNKQKLWVETVGFMKDKMSLASYNVTDGCVIKLEVKERGGRKRGGA